MQAHVDALRSAEADHVDLLVFPEASLTGYPAQVEEVAPNMMAADDSRLLSLARLAGDVVTVVGFMENAGAGRVFNSMAWLHQGRVLGVHRKINLPSYGRLNEGAYFQSGEETTHLSLPGSWQCGGLICADFWDPGLAYLSALAQDDLLVVPFASTRRGVGGGFSNVEGWPRILANHASVYGMPIVACNWVGGFQDDLQFWGGSSIYDANGQALVTAGDTADFIVADIERNDILQARKRLPTIRDLSPNILAREIIQISETQDAQD